MSPNATMVFYVWGNGSLNPTGDARTHTFFEDADAASDWPEEADGSQWCIVVEATEEDIDLATRFNAAVKGYKVCT